MYEMIRKRFIWFIVIIVFMKYGSTLETFQSKKYKAKGYEVLVPKEWKYSKKHSRKIRSENSYQTTNVVAFVPVGHEKWEEEDLEAKIFIFSTKLETSMWIEDQWPDIKQAIRQAGLHIIDEGEIKVSDVISQWVFFHDKQAKVLQLEFYIITEDNMFFKLQYSAQDKLFNNYRQGFEKLKEGFLIKFSMF